MQNVNSFLNSWIKSTTKDSAHKQSPVSSVVQPNKPTDPKNKIKKATSIINTVDNELSDIERKKEEMKE